MSERITLEDVRTEPRVKTFIQQADKNLEAIGYTEHGFRHAKIVARDATRVLEELGYPERDCELAAISGYLHDIGNVVSRIGHPVSTGWICHKILAGMGMADEELVLVMGAAANHDEEYGDPVNPISSAVILADKADVHSSRVRNPKHIAFDIHDRVNYAVKKSRLVIDAPARMITLDLTIDTEISNVVEYFEIFLSRMLHSRRATKLLDCEFRLLINEQEIG